MDTDTQHNGFWHRLRVWAASHKFRSVLLLLGAFVLLELLTIPWFSVRSLRTDNPAETALMRQRIREAESEGKDLKIVQKWVPLSRIPRHVINAVVVAEDGTFWEHGGFDWYEFEQSVKKNWEKKRAVRGASTITQQLAKNLYLSTSKDPVRKLKEWIITVLLEHYLDKNRILELYLNVIEWGRGIFGIEAAAEKYFGRSAGSLSYEQALRLAAVIPSPLKHRPSDDSRWVLFRKNVIAQRMMGRKYLDIDQEPDEEDSDQSTENAPVPPDLHTKVDSAVIPPPAVPVDSSERERGDSNDIQRRDQAD